MPLSLRTFALSLFALTLAFPGSAAAQDVTFRFSGQVTEVYGWPFPNITQGSTIEGCYTFNLSTPEDPGNSSANHGTYIHRQAPAGMVVQVGSAAFQTNRAVPDFWVTIGNDYYGRDFYGVSSSTNLLANGQFVYSIGFGFDDYTAQALSSTALSTTPPDVNAFQTNPYSFNVSGSGSEWNIYGSITAIVHDPEGTCDPVDPGPGPEWP